MLVSRDSRYLWHMYVPRLYFLGVGEKVEYSFRVSKLNLHKSTETLIYVGRPILKLSPWTIVQLILLPGTLQLVSRYFISMFCPSP
ncbi:Protein of unknown function [Pyronema omphalodes CBS 100304]|uniref:Uncharacterized protein n=1 Tax=Pyronema omphalodes (strain CBS 100304) TaxID=1076935 RepID=U4LSU9_PYROM|nr:Protein of unknown function [Pyronema omphalodes CBS 100304]